MAPLLKRRGVASRWETAVLVCGKCSRKIDGGFGEKGRTPLAKALRKLAGLGKGRKATAGVVEVKCLGLCPKGAVAVVDAAQPGAWLLVYPGDDVDALAAQLRLREG